MTAANINDYTKQFWSHRFPGWHMPYDREHLIKHFWTTEIPVVNLPDTVDVESAWQATLALDSSFQPMDQEQHGNNQQEWWMSPRYTGWHSLGVISNNTTAITDLDGNTIVYPDWGDHREHFQDYIDKMEQIGLPLRHMRILKLDPGGWIAPHRDGLVSRIAMRDLWIPLSHDASSLKIWPLGEHTVRRGQVCFLCNHAFPHSVINDSDRPRYVIKAQVDVNRVSMDAYKRIVRAVLEAYAQD